MKHITKEQNQEKFYEYNHSGEIILPMIVSLFTILVPALMPDFLFYLIYIVSLSYFSYTAWGGYFAKAQRLTWPKAILREIKPFENEIERISNKLKRKPHYEHIIEGPEQDTIYEFSLYGTLVLLEIRGFKIAESEKKKRALESELKEIEAVIFETEKTIRKQAEKDISIIHVESEKRRKKAMDSAEQKIESGTADAKKRIEILTAEIAELQKQGANL